MSVRVDDYEFPDNMYQRGPQTYRIDWYEIADGNIWKFSRGVDYDVPNNICSAGRQYATRNGVHMRSRVEDDGESVYMQFYVKGHE